ncbi:MAG: hypothetical protein B7733_07110 [Myxococcales bacterium FL481]|nr:MAG: hypothetical protein B7733_07110 [Myxococcales bacterium FL481]
MAQTLFPFVNVQKDSDKYFTYGRTILGDGNSTSEWLDSTDPPEVTSGRSTQSFSCVQHGLADYVTDEEIRNSDNPLQPFMDTTAELTERLLLELEKQVATKATTQGNYPAANTTQLSGTSQWSDFTNGDSDPIDDILVGIDVIRTQIGKMGNICLAVGGAVHFKLIQHPDVVDFAKRSLGRLPNNADMVNLFQGLGVNRYVVAGGVKNTADEGAAESISDVWGKHAVLAYPPDSPGLKRPAYGYTFSSVRARVEREPRRNHAVKVIASMTWDPQFICQDSNGDSIAGYLIEDAVA